MLKTSRLLFLAILGAIAAIPVLADDLPVAKVNGVAIPQERIDFSVKAAAAQGQADTPELRKNIRENLINIEVIAQEAIKNGLDKQPDVIQQEALTKENLLANAFVQDYLKTHPISDEAITKEYNTAKTNAGAKEYSVRHILVNSEEEAKAIAAKLKKGGKENTFEKLAKANSLDPTKKDGGDLGWIAVGNIPNAFVKPFGDALLNLSKGQISEPVHTQYGWHIIKLEDVRDYKFKPLDDLKPRIIQILQQEAVKQLIIDLRSKAKIE